eukprot:3484395-Rhodomonas_salina.1
MELDEERSGGQMNCNSCEKGAQKTKKISGSFFQNVLACFSISFCVNYARTLLRNASLCLQKINCWIQWDVPRKSCKLEFEACVARVTERLAMTRRPQELTGQFNSTSRVQMGT